MKQSIYLLRALLLTVLVTAILVSCASIGNPSGGPRDEDPPVFVRANPAPGSVNVKKDRIEIEFDELINVKDAFSKVVISPVSKQVPRVSSQGRKVIVQFNDTLQANTTYTVDFSDAIEDNNEANKLQGFTYSFSTGPTIDTLMISGMVLSAEALEPQQGMLVGVYSNLSDTAFSTLPFERIAKTDDRGRFTIHGLAPGEYRVFALADVDNDYHRANPEEAMAFLDFTVSPTAERIETTDTILDLTTGLPDTVVTRQRTRFLPNDLLLRSFESDYKPQYLQKYERVDSTRVRLIFNAPSDSLPLLDIVSGPDTKYQDWWTLERSAHNDTLTYWLLPERLVSTDSLRLGVSYLRTDSAKMLSLHTDTLRFFTDRPKVKKKKADKKKVETGNQESGAVNASASPDSISAPPVPLPMKFMSGSTLDVYAPYIIEFDTPLAELDTAAFSLVTLVDTIWEPVKKPWKLSPLNDLNPRVFKIEYPWEFGTEYQIVVDTLAATGIYGRRPEPQETKFKIKSEDDYCAITFNITNFTDSVPVFMEIVNSSDAPVKRVPVTDGKAYFQYLTPGKYYARIYEDFNGDGIYTTGNLDSLRQPDAVYYYPKIINIKKNWEKTESWAVFDTAVDLMKPEAVKKNKPQADKRARNNKNENNNGDDDDDEGFDPARNPFDPNYRRR